MYGCPGVLSPSGPGSTQHRILHFILLQAALSTSPAGNWVRGTVPYVRISSSTSLAVRERLIVQNFIAAPAPVFRRDAWLACGGADEDLWYTADWDVWLKLAGLGPVRYHNLITVGFRIHASSLTATGSRNPLDFAEQMHIVLARHLPNVGGGSKKIEKAAHASIVVNTALASAAAGDVSGLLRAARAVLRLGPSGIFLYLRDSRILDRVASRLRAKLAGAY